MSAAGSSNNGAAARAAGDEAERAQRRLLVSRLPQGASAEWLLAVFSLFGHVSAARLVADSPGAAELEFTKPDGVEAALRAQRSGFPTLQNLDLRRVAPPPPPPPPQQQQQQQQPPLWVPGQPFVPAAQAYEGDAAGEGKGAAEAEAEAAAAAAADRETVHVSGLSAPLAGDMIAVLRLFSAFAPAAAVSFAGDGGAEAFVHFAVEGGARAAVRAAKARDPRLQGLRVVYKAVFAKEQQRRAAAAEKRATAESRQRGLQDWMKDRLGREVDIAALKAPPPPPPPPPPQQQQQQQQQPLASASGGGDAGGAEEAARRERDWAMPRPPGMGVRPRLVLTGTDALAKRLPGKPRAAKGPDGTRGFAAGRGRPLAVSAEPTAA